ncbi:hypothetical protein JX266_006886 [Neoarthrinium moseri]|nr:hypothetical protein JX266_006886 [Neoarthrinium moseri]
MAPAANIDTAVSNSSAALHSPRHARSRTQSVSSDRPSTIAHSLMSPPLAVSPEAAFIAASAASQIVTNDHDSHAETWYDQVGIEPSGETALVSNGALQLANNFVDQLLFNIIGVARATTLGALRPAVSEVLKPKLAKDAVNQADEELREYLGGGEVDDLVQSPTEESSRDWDLELVWKRTRLRCMVYSSLGDMEEEDEDYFMEQEHLNAESEDPAAGVVSPAVAIFLTSILEYMGEQVLVVAGQAAFNRLRTRYEKDLKDGTRSAGDVSERIVVEELDMERVALDRTLGRLWRSWKKRIRSPTEPNFSRAFTRSATHSRHGSTAGETLQGLHSPREVVPESEETKSKGQVGEEETAESKLEPDAIPLPIGENDVAEIEVPGLVWYSDEEDSDADDEDEDASPPRPKSLMIFSSIPLESPPTPGLSQPHTPVQLNRRRANSLPTPATSPYSLVKTDKYEADLPQAEEEEDAAIAENPELTTSESSSLLVAPDSNLNEDGVSPLETPLEEEPTAEHGTDRISKIMSGAAAVGSAAVAGVAAMVQGTAPQTVPTPMEEDEIDDFPEEAEILTSSRVSFGGRSSPSASESGRPPSLLVRSNSVRSVRVIDVQGPKSPSVKSRNGSVDIPDFASSRPMSNISRDGGISTPPIAEEGVDSDSSARASKRNAVIVPTIEDFRETRPSRDVAPTSAPHPARSVAPTSAPRSTSSENVTRVATVGAGAGRSFLDLDAKPDVPQKPAPQQKQPAMPTVPERSSGRPSVERNHSGARSSPESPQTTRAKLADSPSSSSSNKHKPRRTSEDSHPQRAQDVAKNFEALLQNNQTLQYTLTPENMRDMNDSNRSQNSGSPVAHHKSRMSEDVKSERSRSSSIKRSLSVTKSTGLNSHPPEAQANGKSHSKLSGPVPRAPPVSMANYHGRAAGAQARDARVPRESIADFADFIRSTGPSGVKAPPARTTAGVAAHGRSTSGSIPVTQASSMESNRQRQGSVNRARLQARDASVSASNESSDLIDFIRRGPPNAGNNPRIPRNVAPFRNTMDSDQLQISGASGGKAVDASIPDIRHSQASTVITENSVPSSINSQSALLNKAKKPAQYGNNFDDEDMIPKRKQRRVRDPYAIDFSDEDDDDFDMAPPPPKPKKEESLIDFLNSYDPPSDPSPPQPFITSQTRQAALQGAPVVPKKKASAPNLISRLRSGGGAVASFGRNGTSVNEARSVSSSQASQGRGYTPINVHIPSGADQFITSAPPSNRAVSSSTGRVPMKRFEPREAVSSNAGSRTSDLANFLRDSEPPPSTLASQPPRAEEKSSGFSRVFERRKKSIAY